MLCLVLHRVRRRDVLHDVLLLISSDTAITCAAIELTLVYRTAHVMCMHTGHAVEAPRPQEKTG
jgi:hypothetical protein